MQENSIIQSTAETQSSRRSFAWSISISKIISLSFQMFSSASLTVYLPMCNSFSQVTWVLLEFM